jgi:hypothetical protein
MDGSNFAIHYGSEIYIRDYPPLRSIRGDGVRYIKEISQASSCSADYLSPSGGPMLEIEVTSDC